MSTIHLIDCPRDAIQGIASFIPTETKVAYMQAALDSQLFSVLDFGSFVSPTAVPQMADTAAVLAGLDLSRTSTELLAIVANPRGVTQALAFPEIAWVGYPFSVSETFQQRNARASREDSLDVVAQALSLAHTHDRRVRVYLSMGFGNPYGDDWSEDLVVDYIGVLAARGATHFALSDTTGEATPVGVEQLFRRVGAAFPSLTFSAHLHATPSDWSAKVEAAYAAGCRIFDGAMLGYGGCPFAQDSLVGNVPTEGLIARFFPEKAASISTLQTNFQSLITSHVPIP